MSCFSLLTPVGGGIPHGAFPEMGPSGIVGQLTEHGPRWAGTHESARSSPDTPPKKHVTAQAGAEARKGGGASSSGCTGCDPARGQSLGCEPDSASCAPHLATDPESASDSLRDSLTDIAAAHLAEPLPVDQPEARQASKFPLDASAGQETAKPRRGSTGEHEVEIHWSAQISEPKRRES